MYYKAVNLSCQKQIKEVLIYLKPYWSTIEKEYQKHLFKIEIIRENRLIDKILWVNGKE